MHCSSTAALTTAAQQTELSECVVLTLHRAAQHSCQHNDDDGLHFVLWRVALQVGTPARKTSKVRDLMALPLGVTAVQAATH